MIDMIATAFYYNFLIKITYKICELNDILKIELQKYRKKYSAKNENNFVRYDL